VHRCKKRYLQFIFDNINDDTFSKHRVERDSERYLPRTSEKFKRKLYSSQPKSIIEELLKF